MAAANVPWNIETNKKDRNLTIMTDRRDLLTHLKGTTFSLEVCLDDWRQQKNVTVELERVHERHYKTLFTPTPTFEGLTWMVLHIVLY